MPDLPTLLARTYRMLFRYETEENDFAPAWFTTLGQMDCRREIRLLEEMEARR